MQISDYNLATEIFPKVLGNDYPLVSAELSVTAAGLERSFTNYPNPFNPSDGGITTIGFVLVEDARVDVEIFTITGEKVLPLLVDDFRPAGSYAGDTWSGLNARGLNVVPGTYFCRITARYASGRVESFRRKIAVIR